LWVSISLLMGEVRVAELCSGFVTREKGVSWPPTNNKDPIPNRGSFVTKTSANPAVNTEISLSVPQGEIWHVLYGSATLVADSTAASRRVHFIFAPSDGASVDLWGTSIQTLSQTRKYNLSQLPGKIDGADNDDLAIPIPIEMWLDGGSTITTETQNIQAGDDWSALQLVVERFFDREV